MFRKYRLARVDLQVSCLISAIVSIVIFITYLFQYTLTHQDMLQTLKAQCYGIYYYLQNQITDDTFSHINSIEDETSPYYIELKQKLETVRDITNVRYLYTAKANEKDELIYLVDGLDYQAKDFRHAGDLIEEEIWKDFRLALTGHPVLPKDILKTSWGNIYICYFPIYNQKNEVIGVLGIEFDASHQYKTFHTLRIAIPLIGISAIFISVIVSVFLFRRISNPSFKNIVNSDYLTNCKNRNAFELDINNLSGNIKQQGIGIFSIDMNGLKKINDTYGHTQGDRYIQVVAKALSDSVTKKMTVYRVGGDEFVVLSFEGSTETDKKLIGEINKKISSLEKASVFSPSVSIGYAAFCPEVDKDLLDTYNRADAKMYQEKQVFYETMKRDGAS